PKAAQSSYENVAAFVGRGGDEQSCRGNQQAGRERSCNNPEWKQRLGHCAKHRKRDNAEDHRAAQKKVLACAQPPPSSRRQGTQPVKDGSGSRRVLRYLFCVCSKFHWGEAFSTKPSHCHHKFILVPGECS